MLRMLTSPSVGFLECKSFHSWWPPLIHKKLRWRSPAFSSSIWPSRARHRRQFLALRPLACQLRSSQRVDGKRFYQRCLETLIRRRVAKHDHRKPRAFNSFFYYSVVTVREIHFCWCTVCFVNKKMRYSVKALGMIVCDKKSTFSADAAVTFWMLEEIRRS